MSAKHIPKDSPHRFTEKVHVRERNVYRIMKYENNNHADSPMNGEQNVNQGTPYDFSGIDTKNRKAGNASSAGHKVVKILITIMLILSIILVAFACGKEFIIDKEPEESSLLPAGFAYEVE